MWNESKPLVWQDVRDALAISDAKLVDIVDQISPDQSFKIHQLQYNYGQQILTKGIFNYALSPTEVVPISSNLVPKIIREDLSNSGFLPLTYVAKNSVSIYFDTDGQYFPIRPISAGAFTGVWPFLDPQLNNFIPSIWSLSAGVTTLLNPNQSRSNKNPYDFVEINHNHDYKWQTELLCFANSWADYRDDDIWQPFYAHLASQNLYRSSFWRNQFTWDYLFSFIQTKINITSNYDAFHIIKQLCLIQFGHMACWIPLDNNQIVPLEEFNRINLDGLNIKENLLFYPDVLNGSRKNGLFLPNASLLFEFGRKFNDAMLFENVQTLLNKMINLLNDKAYSDVFKNTKMDTILINEKIVCLENAATSLEYLQELKFVGKKSSLANLEFFHKSIVVKF